MPDYDFTIGIPSEEMREWPDDDPSWDDPETMDANRKEVIMGKHKMELTEEQIDKLKIEFEAANEKIAPVAASLNVGWQTARRWLILAGCVEASERLDRPGLVWSRFRVATEGWIIWNVEAPNWAIACETVWRRVKKLPTVVELTDMPISDNFDRGSVKAMLPEYMDRSLSISDLAQHYIGAGVIVR